MQSKDTTERWLPVVGYEGFYEVSDLGRVRSLDRTVPHKLYGSKRIMGRMLALRRTRKYPSITMNKLGSQKNTKVHTLVLSAFVEPRPKGKECRHLDGDPTNNHLTNLVWGTRSENMKDRNTHAPNHSRGESNNSTKLTEQDVLEIRRRSADGESNESVAKDFPITNTQVWRIFNRHNWSHLP